MTIPTPPADASGGLLVLKVSSAAGTHRSRFHVLPFGTDSTGAYTTPPSGGEASVVATATAIMNGLKPFMSTAVTMALDSVWRLSAGVLALDTSIVPPATVAGVQASAETRQDTFMCFNFRALNGGRFRFFLFGNPNWGVNPPGIYSASSSAGDIKSFMSLLTGATTAVVAHNGQPLIPPMRVTYGINKRLRRRLGDA